jgi:hypothetical protein
MSHREQRWLWRMLIACYSLNGLMFLAVLVTSTRPLWERVFLSILWCFAMLVLAFIGTVGIGFRPPSK